MKKLIILFSLISSISYSQTTSSYTKKVIRSGRLPSTSKVIAYKENKDLALVIANRLNQFRRSINRKDFIWSEYWYNSALKWNNYLADNSVWGHRTTQFAKENHCENSHELIVGVTLLDVQDINLDTKLYEFIADSCIQRWRHSDLHNEAITAPIRTKNRITDPSCLNGMMQLTNHMGISVNVTKHDGYVIVMCVMHLGYGIDNINCIQPMYK